MLSCNKCALPAPLRPALRCERSGSGVLKLRGSESWKSRDSSRSCFSLLLTLWSSSSSSEAEDDTRIFLNMGVLANDLENTGNVGVGGFWLDRSDAAESLCSWDSLSEVWRQACIVRREGFTAVRARSWSALPAADAPELTSLTWSKNWHQTSAPSATSCMALSNDLTCCNNSVAASSALTKLESTSCNLDATSSLFIRASSCSNPRLQ
mmetsp:Transcript_13744/g.26633  ORF Transcript_13744/g.26633 Transcript_13744/m.26633 type:complete len:209 (-) Transcript_13744:200-826(-)